MSEISFNINYENHQYKRPLYDPLWKVNYKRKWCYIPGHIDINMHRLFIIPTDRDTLYDFFGILGFHEKFQSIKPSQYRFLIYNFHITKVVSYKNQLLLIGIPSRTGVQVISVNQSDINACYQKNINNSCDDANMHNVLTIRLVTPDNFEIDCNSIVPFYTRKEN